MDYTFINVCAGSFTQAAISTALSLFLALPLAHFLHLFCFKGKQLLTILIPLLCIIPSKITALGVLYFYRCMGFPAIILAHTTLNIPLIVFMLMGVYAYIDYGFSLVAQEFGASRWRVYKDIYLPLLKPVCLASVGIVFLLCISSFSIPQFFATNTYCYTADIMMSQLYATNNSDFFWYGLFRLCVIIPIAFFMPAQQLFNGYSNNSFTHYFTHYLARYNPLRHGIIWGLYMLGMLVLLFAPLVTVLCNACTMQVIYYLADIWHNKPDLMLNISLMHMLKTTIAVALCSSILNVLFAILCAFCVIYAKNKFAVRMIGLIALLPFLVSSVGCGIIFSWLGYYGNWSPLCIMIFCHLILNFPFAYRLILGNLNIWSNEWENTALMFGANFMQRLVTLKLPFIKNSLYQAFIICFGLSLTEVGASSIFKNEGYITLPMAVKIYREHAFDAGVIGLNIILLAIVFIGAGSLHLITGRTR